MEAAELMIGLPAALPQGPARAAAHPLCVQTPADEATCLMCWSQFQALNRDLTPPCVWREIT